MSDDDGSEQSSRAGNAAKTAAKTGAKKGGKSLGKKLVLILGIKGIVIALVIGLCLLVIAAAAAAVTGQQAAAQPVNAGCGAPTPAGSASGTAPGVTAEQNANATAIITVALGLGLGYQGALIGVLTADVESDLVNVTFGDMTGPGGSMSSSRGLFQQLSAWGSLADRMDPAKSATMFYTGGAAGQRGLMQVPGWQTMDPGVAMQAAQGSQFAGGTSPGYAQKLALATSVTKAIMGASANTPVTATVPVAAPAPCPTPGAAHAVGNVTVNGVAVTIPDNPNVAAAVRGKVIQAPNAGIAKGLAAGFGTLGTLYVWGGGFGPVGAATDGCARGGGALNSCQGQIGWDCSGLANYVLVQGGFPSLGGSSDAQRSTGTDIPWAQGLPGDLIGYPGHISVYLGTVDGLRYQLEASDVGTPNRVIAVFRTDFDPSLHRHWS